MTPNQPVRASTVAAAQQRKRTRRVLPILGAVLLVGLITYGLWPQPVPVETGRVVVGPLRATVNEEGRTRIRHRFTVSAPVAGQLRRIKLKAGDPVKEGEIVAVVDALTPAPLDPRSRALAEAGRDAASANVDKAKAALTFAASELQRFRKLHQQGSISEQELESVALREATARKEVAAAEGTLRQAEAELAEFSGGSAPTHSQRQLIVIKAPASGAVLRVFEESARVTAPGMPLLEMGDTTDLEVVVDVLSRDGAAIQPGTLVYLDQWGGAEPLEARVRLVEPAAFTKISALGVEEQRVNVIADLVTPPEQRRNVGDHFRVEARIVVWEDPRALKVPAGALFRKGERWAAFVVENGKAVQRLVTVGKSSGTETQILEGLKDGETVILYPGTRVKEGGRVKPITI